MYMETENANRSSDTGNVNTLNVNDNGSPRSGNNSNTLYVKANNERASSAYEELTDRPTSNIYAGLGKDSTVLKYNTYENNQQNTT